MSNNIYYLFLALSIVCNGVAGIFLKSGSNLINLSSNESLVKTLLSMVLNWKLIVGIVFYGMSFFISLLAYSKINLSIGYPIIVTGTLILVTIGGIAFFGEKLTGVQIFGLVLLIGGILLISSDMKVQG